MVEDNKFALFSAIMTNQSLVLRNLFLSLNVLSMGDR